MDRLGGYFGAHEANEPLDDYVGEDDSLPEPPPSPVGQDERRMQVRAYNHWASLLGNRNYPLVDDLEPQKLDDFGPYSVLLDFSGGIEDPIVRYVGAELAAECGEDAVLARLSDVPSRSVLSRITDHYMQILANQAPIGFEAEFVNEHGRTVLYRGILLPFSSDNYTIDFIYGVINWKEIADQAAADELLLEIGYALGEYEDEAVASPLASTETAESLTAQGEVAMDDEGEDVFELGNAHLAAPRIDSELPAPSFGLDAPTAKPHRGVDALGNPIGGHGGGDGEGYDEDDGYGDFDRGIKTAADYGLPEWDEEEEEEYDDVDGVVDPLADDALSSSLMSLVSRNGRNKKLVDLSGSELAPAIPQGYAPEAVPSAYQPKSSTITYSQPSSLLSSEAEGEEEDAPPTSYSHDFGFNTQSYAPYGETDEDRDEEDEEDEGGTYGSFYGQVHGDEAEDDAQFAIKSEASFAASDYEETAYRPDFQETVENSSDAGETGPPEGLHDCLAAARELAQAAQNTEDRSRKALYQAVSLAYDFSLETEADPDGFVELLEDNGLTMQERAPMTPVVKLVFGADYDKTRLTEYAAVLMHAHRIGVARGALAGFLHEVEGGLKAVVNAERRARKEEQGKPVEETDGVRKALAKQLRRLDALDFGDLDVEGPEFALVMVRRTLDGKIVILGEVPEDIPLVERAARKLLG